MTAGRRYILILPPLLSNSETSLPIQRVTCRAFFSRVWGLYDCGNPLLFILLKRHVFHAFSMESKEGMQDVESWQHLFSHQLHVYVGTYCPDHLPQTREPYLLLVHQRPTTQPQATSEALGQLGEVWERSCGGLQLEGRVWKRVWGSSSQTAQPFQASHAIPILNPESLWWCERKQTFIKCF